MNKNDWGALLASGGAVANVLFAVWPGGMLEDGVQKAANNPEWFFLAHMIAGTIGVLAMLIAYRAIGLSRLLLGVGALLTFSMLVTEPFHYLVIFTIVLPAISMALGALVLSNDVPVTTSRSTGPAVGRV